MFPYTGGKSREIKHYVGLIPQHINTFVDVFVGAGSTSLVVQELVGKQKITIDRHIVNDTNTDIISVYEHMSDVDFVNEVNAEIGKFNDLPTFEEQKLYHLDNVLKLNAKCANDRIQALRFLMYVKLCFRSILKQVNGKYTNRTINLRPLKGQKTTHIANVRDFNALLKNVEYVSRDFADVIREYGGDEENFLFCDPPYLECETPNILYGQDFNKTHYELLFKLFSECQAKCMIVVNDTPYVRELFDGYIKKEYDYVYHASRITKRAVHLVITNF